MLMMGYCATFLVAAILVQHIHLKGAALKVHDNKYDDILVAIHPNVTENRQIIKEINSMFELGSETLYTATKNMFHFGNVKILIPETWSKDPSWSLATTETFKDADIRVDRSHVSHGSDPYTFQPGLCGEPGKYIHFTPGYLLDEKGDREANYGDMGRTLVHEFSHLRYGVFDEYGLGTDDHPHVYLDDEALFPTACADIEWKGSYTGNCTIDTTTSRPHNSCNFRPDRAANTARASIMYDPSVERISHFCESNSKDPNHQHNSLAPNQHNKMCKGEGTWDVIKEHPDFKGGNPPVNMTASQRRPSFNILYGKKTITPNGTEVCGRPVVLVLDLSGSMKTKNRYYKQTQTTDKVVRDSLPVGTKVGVVTFSTDATEWTPLTPLLTPSDRDKVAKNLPSRRRYTGSTAIGKGLLAAKNMLETAGVTEGGRIVLITDGEENVEPNVETVKGEIIKSGIRVHTVAYSDAAASAISELSKETGGQYAFFSESENSTVLDSVIETLMKDISTCENEVRIEIMRKATKLMSGANVEDQITIDSTVGDDAMFVFTLPNRVDVDIILSSPDGNSYNSGSTEYSLDRMLNIVRFKFKKAENGTWHYTMSANSPGTVTLVVKALPVDNADPYELDSWMSSIFSDVSYGSKYTVVYAHVHKGYSPVIGADVTVTVERPAPATPVVLKPLDNGILPDNMADDGVYSGYFTEFQGNERYSLDAEVKSVQGKTKFYKKGPPKYGGARSRYQNTTGAVVAIFAENFTRTSSPGAIDVTGFQPDTDSFPPSPVTDLKVAAFDREDGTVTLTWTAPGDDLNSGNASHYDMRISRTSESFRGKFTKLDKVEPNMIISGKRSLVPNPAGSKERMVIKTPANWTTIVFAVKTYDEVNHESDLSNIVTATFKKVKLKGQTTTTTITTITTIPTTTPTTTTTTTPTTTTPLTTTPTTTTTAPTTTTTTITTTPTTTFSTTPTTPTTTSTTSTTTPATTTTTPTISASTTTTPAITNAIAADITPTTTSSIPSTPAVTITSSATTISVISPTSTFMWCVTPNNQQTVMAIAISVGVLLVG